MNAATVSIHSRRYRFTKGVQFIIASCFLVLAVSGCAEMPDSPERDRLLMGMTMQHLFPSLAKDLHCSADQKGLAVVGFNDIAPSTPGTKQNIPSPARAAGMQVGDVIVKIRNSGGKLIDVTDLKSYHETLDALSENEPVVLEVLREGKASSFDINRVRGESMLTQLPARPEPRTLKVSASGNGDFRSITGAMIAARSGDTILIGSGVYEEPVRHDGGNGVAVFRDNLTIASEDPKNRAKIQGQLRIEMRGTRVQSLDIGGDADQVGVGIVDTEAVTIENCAISGAMSGIASHGSKGVTLRNNLITDNGGGVYLVKTSFLLEGNLIERNAVGEPGERMMMGVFLHDSKGELSHNTILNHKTNYPDYVKSFRVRGTPGTGILVAGDSNVSIYSNIVSENNVGVFVDVYPQEKSPVYRIEYNDVYNNVVEGSSEHWTGDFSEKIVGDNWDYTAGVNTVVDENPRLSLRTWRHTTYSPKPPRISQTNLSTDPFFADPANGDYHLSADSPLIGRGRSGSHIGAFGPVGQKVGEGEFK